MLASVLTLSCYIWFLLPPTWTVSALPGVLFFGAGLGFAPCMGECSEASGPGTDALPCSAPCSHRTLGCAISIRCYGARCS
jgi:hypothetical protein